MRAIPRCTSCRDSGHTLDGAYVHPRKQRRHGGGRGGFDKIRRAAPDGAAGGEEALKYRGCQRAALRVARMGRKVGRREIKIQSSSGAHRI
jgi:hypothetical protein